MLASLVAAIVMHGETWEKRHATLAKSRERLHQLEMQELANLKTCVELNKSAEERKANCKQPSGVGLGVIAFDILIDGQKLFSWVAPLTCFLFGMGAFTSGLTLLRLHKVVVERDAVR
ncbi:MAG: hypothetical protein ACRCWJ_04830 [Casimicrobium sp.]